MLFLRIVDGIKQLGRISKTKADTDKFEANTGTYHKDYGKVHDKSVVSTAKNKENLFVYKSNMYF